MKVRRQCSRLKCEAPAVATMTYDTQERTVVIGPLSTVAQLGAQDLCERHAQNLVMPQGWEIIRLATEFVPAEPSEEDLEALANVVRQASKRPTRPQGWDGRIDNNPAPDAQPEIAKPKLRIVPGGKES